MEDLDSVVGRATTLQPRTQSSGRQDKPCSQLIWLPNSALGCGSTQHRRIFVVRFAARTKQLTEKGAITYVRAEVYQRFVPWRT